MIEFYYSGGPNPMKVALFLEEAGLPYHVVPIDTFRGEQFSPEVAHLNPNNKLPIVVENGVAIFDSNAILLYLAEKHGRFLPQASERAALLSWLMFAATGLGPYCGQAVHFRHYAPEPKDYAVERYSFEARRHYGVLETRLSDREWLVGSDYSIVDMAVWGWARNIDLILGEGAGADFPRLMGLLDRVSARPAAQAAIALREKFDANRTLDAEARRHMFRHVGAADRVGGA